MTTRRYSLLINGIYRINHVRYSFHRAFNVTASSQGQYLHTNNQRPNVGSHSPYSSIIATRLLIQPPRQNAFSTSLHRSVMRHVPIHLKRHSKCTLVRRFGVIRIVSHSDSPTSLHVNMPIRHSSRHGCETAMHQSVGMIGLDYYFFQWRCSSDFLLECDREMT